MLLAKRLLTSNLVPVVGLAAVISKVHSDIDGIAPDVLQNTLR